tara:strand:+ start:4804 stop:6273 length:1470 start_codon:yes stop_codon:yes gene_type:complete
MLYYYSNSTDFLLTDISNNIILNESMIRKECETYLFGYCLSTEEYKNNENLSESSFTCQVDKNIDYSGVYVAVRFQDGKVQFVIDPLCQFNIFYFSDGLTFVMSSSINAIKDFLNLREVNSAFLYDQIAYQSPMRGLTILNKVFYIQFDDIAYKQKSRKEFDQIDNNKLLKIHRPKYSIYDNYSYGDLLDLYIERLNLRAKLVASIFDKVHVQLTGGADSRLTVSSFSGSDNVECYVYGNGASQSRLIFEEILRARSISPASSIRFVGQPLNCTPRIVKGLHDSNFLKLDNLNTYMNGSLCDNENYCKITGYYGANVCGGVVLPPPNTALNSRLSKVPEGLFTYHDYVDDFAKRNGELRPAAFNDRFYINNRGKGHYAAHSIADNKNVDSVDILYDFINLLLVEKCPYSDSEIDKNAISIDLIYKNDKQLALFPYDDRKVPKYRHFENIPLINCFDGFSFKHQKLQDFNVIRPNVNFDSYVFFLKAVPS